VQALGLAEMAARLEPMTGRAGLDAGFSGCSGVVIQIERFHISNLIVNNGSHLSK
jgi:hypothetical protein